MNPMPITREDVERAIQRIPTDSGQTYDPAGVELMRVQTMLMVEMRDLLLEIYQRLPREDL